MAITLSAALLALSILPAPPQETAPPPAFPPTSPVAVGLSPAALEQLDALIASLVEDDEVVGGELLVIKEGKTVLHTAHGWSDRDEKRPLEPGSLYCVRSMTKPLIGTAILMLVDDKALRLDDPASRYLPILDNDTWRHVTIEHLITHTSGLPFSLLLGRDLEQFEDIHKVAALTADYKPDFEAGSDIQYSDQGTDTLTAVIEVVSGMPAEDFVRTRILEPLGMDESRCLLPEDEPLRARSVAKYTGARGEWTRFWSPADPSLFPCFLGSQGLYSTAEDYAKFLEFWMNKGRVDRERLLSARRIRKALRPGPHRLVQGTGFAELRTEYGHLMTLYFQEREDGKDELIAFGHSGSDGTHAWAFPDEDALALYFTQSRGNMTGLRVEEALGWLLLGDEYDPNVEAPPLEDYFGYYWEGEDDLYRAVVREGSGLGLEILGKTVVPLQYVGEDTWKMLPNPSQRLAFQRSEEGVILGYRIGEHQEYRFEPAADLPSVDEVIDQLVAAHGMRNLEEVGPIRLRATVNMPTPGITGTLDLIMASGGRFRADYDLGDKFEKISFDGERVRYASPTEGPLVVEGARAERLKNDNLVRWLGDWRQSGEEVEVIQRLVQASGRRVLVVRATPVEGYAKTRFVDEESGLLGREDSINVVPGMGALGQQLSLGDYQEIGGMILPYRMEVEFATPLLGTMSLEVEEVELGVELAEDVFEIR